MMNCEGDRKREVVSYLRFCHCELATAKRPVRKQSHIGGGMASYLAIPNRFLSLRACEAVSYWRRDGPPSFQDATQSFLVMINSAGEDTSGIGGAFFVIANEVKQSQSRE